MDNSEHYEITFRIPKFKPMKALQVLSIVGITVGLFNIAYILSVGQVFTIGMEASIILSCFGLMNTLLIVAYDRQVTRQNEKIQEQEKGNYSMRDVLHNVENFKRAA